LISFLNLFEILSAPNKVGRAPESTKPIFIAPPVLSKISLIAYSSEEVSLKFYFFWI